MSAQHHLSVHAANTWLSLELAKKEAAHLHYSHTTLFALDIDLLWVENLAQRPALDALVHEYMQDAQDFLDSLHLARQSSQMLFDAIAKTEAQLTRLGIEPPTGETSFS